MKRDRLKSPHISTYKMHVGCRNLTRRSRCATAAKAKAAGRVGMSTPPDPERFQCGGDSHSEKNFTLIAGRLDCSIRKKQKHIVNKDKAKKRKGEKTWHRSSSSRHDLHLSRHTYIDMYTWLYSRSCMI